LSLQEYIYITISIIYGLAITRLLAKVFNALRRPHADLALWPRSMWSTGVAIVLVWFIWIGYQIQSMEGLNYGVFIYLLVTAIALYGAVEFSFPDDQTHAEVWHRESRLSAVFVIAYLLIVGSANVALANAGFMDTMKLTGIGILLALAVVIKPQWLHWVAPCFLLYALLVHSPLQRLIGL